MCQRSILVPLVAAAVALGACGPSTHSSVFGDVFSPADAGGDASAEPDAAPPPAPPPSAPLPPPPAASICSAPQGTAAAASALVDADTSFAVAFYGPAVAAAGAASNVILSPFSASAALTMIDVGAAGATDTQIQSVLHLPGNGASVAPAYAAVACQDETDAAWGSDVLSIANAVWGQQGKSFLPAFLSSLSTGFQAPLEQADFAGDPGGAMSTINQWVSQQTRGTIPTVLQPGDIDDLTRIVLVDAVYFNGTWATGFDPAQTAPQPFTLADGTTVSVPTMSGNVEVASGYLSESQLTTYELAYVGGALAMDFLVPDGSLASFESTLTPDVLGAALKSLQAPSSGQLSVPKFSFSTRLVLGSVLSGMGMTDVFNPATADLSDMDGAKDLYLTTVVQQAFIEVDEQGTVAAAATVGGGGAFLGAGSEPAAINRPFLFLIRDTKTGSILFLGHVGDPRQGS